MIVYRPYYKCRLCGEFEYGDSTTEDAALNAVICRPISNSFRAHACSDDSVGIADLQGFKAEDEPKDLLGSKKLCSSSLFPPWGV